MMMTSSRTLFAAALLLLALADAAAALGNYANEWRVSERTPFAEPTRAHTIHFVLRHTPAQVDELARLATAVSTPSHARYGAHLAKADVDALMAAPAQAREDIVDYVLARCGSLSSHRALGDAAAVTDLGDAVRVHTSVECIERLFPGERMRVYTHVATGFEIVRRCDRAAQPLAMPAWMREHVAWVDGLTGFVPVRRPASAAPGAREPAARRDAEFGGHRGEYVVPQTVRAQYSVPADAKCTNPASSQAVIEFLPVGAPRFADLQKFAEQSAQTFYNISRIVGPFSVNGFNGESTLDQEYISVLGATSKSVYITVSDGWMYIAAQTLLQMTDPPLVSSISYGWPELFNCQAGVTHAHCSGDDAATYTARANVEFSKLAAIGLTVIVCDQDEGAPSEANIACLNTQHPVYSIYPSASPWVTAVSASTVGEFNKPLPNPPALCGERVCTAGGTEVPCEETNTAFRWTTGGGFSAYAAMPDYQKGPATLYLSAAAKQHALLPPAAAFNATNRAYPDVTAVGDRILIIQDGGTQVTAGTSAATPIFAGLVTLLNDASMNKRGGKKLGFLNPLLYAAAAAQSGTFNDIATGTNKCSEGHCCTYGYQSIKGFDVPTGLGSPNFALLLDYVEAQK